MVTPITRRRPIKLAREATTLDHLSRGRLTLGLGLGVDTTRELSGFGEITDARVRGERLDGLFPIEVDGDALMEMLDVVRSERGSLDGFDVMVNPASNIPYDTFEDRGATWAVTGPAPGADDTMAMASTPPADLFSAR